MKLPQQQQIKATANVETIINRLQTIQIHVLIHQMQLNNMEVGKWKRLKIMHLNKEDVYDI